MATATYTTFMKPHWGGHRAGWKLCWICFELIYLLLYQEGSEMGSYYKVTPSLIGWAQT